MKVTFRGFHGTLASRVESIRTSGVYPSDNPDDWLGEGAYFFVDGLDDPWTSAFQWARCKAWDKADQEFDEQDLAVIEVSISVDDSEVFDLREPGRAQEFHRVRRRWLKARIPRRSTNRPRPGQATYDTDLLDEFKRDHGTSVLIADFHIQLSLRERHFRLDSRIPNVSVLCLSKPAPDATLAVINVKVVPQASLLESEPE